MAERRRAALRCGLSVGVLLLSACGSSAVSRAGLEESVTTAFGHLYVRQQALLGQPYATEAMTAARSTCERGGPGVPDRDHGDDWVCAVQWTDVGGAARRTGFEVQVLPDGCYKATAPPALTPFVPFTPSTTGVAGSSGPRARDPLQAFDGCLR